jgi:hypothetical protein
MSKPIIITCNICDAPVYTANLSHESIGSMAHLCVECYNKGYRLAYNHIDGTRELVDGWRDGVSLCLKAIKEGLDCTKPWDI